MIIYAIGCFLVAALGGLVMAVQIFKDRIPSKAIAILHGILGAAGLALLLWVALTSKVTVATMAALVILLIAAFGGFFLMSFHLRGESHPKPVVLIHAGVAVLGVAALIVAIV